MKVYTPVKYNGSKNSLAKQINGIIYSVKTNISKGIIMDLRRLYQQLLYTELRGVYSELLDIISVNKTADGDFPMMSKLCEIATHEEVLDEIKCEVKIEMKRLMNESIDEL